MGSMNHGRSDGGQRLYSDRDVHRLTVLRALTASGRTIHSVAGLSDADAAALLEEDLRETPAHPAAGTPARDADPEGADAVARAYACVRRLDAEGLETLLWRAAMSTGARAFLDDVLAPLPKRVGRGWVEGEVTPAQEHLASGVVERLLQRLADSFRSAAGRGMVVATLPGERHRLGVRLVATVAALEGWRVHDLGTDLPPAEIAAAAGGVGAAAVAISVVRTEGDDVVSALADLRGRLEPSVPVVVGGRRAVALRGLPPGVTVLDGLGALRTFCRAAGR